MKGGKDGYFYVWVVRYRNNMKPKARVRIWVWAKNIGTDAGLGEYYPHPNLVGAMLICYSNILCYHEHLSHH